MRPLLVVVGLCLSATAAAQTGDHGLSLLLLDTPKPGSVRAFVRFQDDAATQAMGASPSLSDFTVALSQGQGHVSVARTADTLGVPTVTIIAVDHSGSFQPAEATVFGILEQLANQATPANRIGLLFFGEQAHSYPTSTSPDELKKDLAEARKLPYENHTRLTKFLKDAMDRAAAEGQPGFRDVILFTDGGEESGAWTNSDLVQMEQRKDVRVSTAVLRPKHSANTEMTHLDRLSKIQSSTGGVDIDLSDAKAGDTITASQHDRAHWYVVDADLCGVGTGANAISVHSRQSFSGNFTFTPPVGGDQPCGTCDPDRCVGWRSCVSGTCQAKSCGADTDCPGGRCASGTCAPLGSTPTPTWPWFALAAGVVALGGLGFHFARRRPPPPPVPPETPPVQEQPPAIAPAAVPAAPASQSEPGAVVSGLEELPETHLEAMKGTPTQGQRWRLTKKTTKLGAGPDNDLVLQIAEISGQHAELQLFPSGQIYIKDLNSRNGTFVNGQRLAQGQRGEIRVGDQIGLSSVLLLKVVRPGVDSPVAAAPPAPGPVSAPPSPSTKGKTIYHRGD